MVRFGLIFVVLAAFFWGLAGGLGAMLMQQGWSAFLVSLFRGGIGLVFVAIWLFFRHKKHGFESFQMWLWSFVAGVGISGNFIFYFMSIAEGSVAVAATLMYCAPVFVYTVSFVLGLENLTALKSLAVMVVMVGIVLLTQVYSVDGSSVTTFAIFAGILSAIFYALFIFGFKYASPYGSTQAILVIAFSTLVVILLFLVPMDEVSRVFVSDSLPIFMTLGVLGGGLSFIMYVNGINYTLPAIASIVAMIEPITASLFGVLFLDEVLDLVQVSGVVLILFAVTVLAVYPGRRGDSKDSFYSL